MPNNNDDIKGLLPDLRGLVDPKVERIIYVAFLRMYEYLTSKISSEVTTVQQAASSQNVQLAERTSQLINNFASKIIKSNQGSGNNPLATLGEGTVTSINITGGAPIFTITGGPITESGSFTVSLNVQTANEFFAAPNGSNGVPTFRLITKEDINIPFKLTTETNADPTITEYSDGTWGLHRNTMSGDIFLAFNNAGVIVKVQLI